MILHNKQLKEMTLENDYKIIYRLSKYLQAARVWPIHSFYCVTVVYYTTDPALHNAITMLFKHLYFKLNIIIQRHLKIVSAYTTVA